MRIVHERSRVKRVEASDAPRTLRVFAPREVLGVSHCAICGESSVELVLEARTDPDLLGGLVVQVGDRVYDSSVRTRLDSLRTHLLASGTYGSA